MTYINWTDVLDRLFAFLEGRLQAQADSHNKTVIAHVQEASEHQAAVDHHNHKANLARANRDRTERMAKNIHVFRSNVGKFPQDAGHVTEDRFGIGGQR